MPTSLEHLTKALGEIQIGQTISVVEGSIIPTPIIESSGRVHVVSVSIPSGSTKRPSFFVERLKLWIHNQEEKRAHLMHFRTLHLDPNDSHLTIYTEQHCGNVLDHVASNPDCDRFVLLRDLMMGLEWLHRHDFVHGAIRGDNIFMKPDGQCYFGEFSQTRVPPRERLLQEPSLAPELFSPRVLRDSLADGWREYYGEFRKASDLFAFGCLVVQVYTEELPEPLRYPQNKRLNPGELMALRRTPSLKELGCIPAEMQTVVDHMLKYHPPSRRTSTDLLKALCVQNPGHYLKVTASVPYVLAKPQMRRLWRSGYL